MLTKVECLYCYFTETPKSYLQNCPTPWVIARSTRGLGPQFRPSSTDCKAHTEYASRSSYTERQPDSVTRNGGAHQLPNFYRSFGGGFRRQILRSDEHLQCKTCRAATLCSIFCIILRYAGASIPPKRRLNSASDMNSGRSDQTGIKSESFSPAATRY